LSIAASRTSDRSPGPSSPVPPGGPAPRGGGARPGAAAGSGAGDARTLQVLRNLDFAVVLLALPVFLLGGLPIVGYLAGSGAWVGQRLIRGVIERRAAAAEDIRTRVGLTAASMIARGWLVAGLLLAVGLSAGDAAGLSAALLFLAIFTVFAVMRLALNPFDRQASSR
jgi:hypothetical protein